MSRIAATLAVVLTGFFFLSGCCNLYYRGAASAVFRHAARGQLRRRLLQQQAQQEAATAVASNASVATTAPVLGVSAPVTAREAPRNSLNGAGLALTAAAIRASTSNSSNGPPTLGQAMAPAAPLQVTAKAANATTAAVSAAPALHADAVPQTGGYSITSSTNALPAVRNAIAAAAAASAAAPTASATVRQWPQQQQAVAIAANHTSDPASAASKAATTATSVAQYQSNSSSTASTPAAPVPPIINCDASNIPSLASRHNTAASAEMLVAATDDATSQHKAAVTDRERCCVHYNSSWECDDGQGIGAVKVTLLHFNDWHVRVEPTKEAYCALCTKYDVEQGRCSGGLARMATFIKEQRRLDPDLLLLNAGDDFIGTEWDRRAGIEAPAAFMNLLKPDAMTVGNHEWDKGLSTLSDYLDKLKIDAVLGANIDFKGHHIKDHVKPYVVKQVKGKRLCILGLTTQYGLPDAGQMESLYIQEPYNIGRQMMDSMKGQNCHATILLSHLGYTSDLVAAKVIPGLDVIIGGHSHSFLWPDAKHPPFYYKNGDEYKSDETWGTYPTWIKTNGRDVPVVQASWGSRYMGKITLTFHPESTGGKLADVDAQVFLLGGPNSEQHVQEDVEALEEIKKWRSW